MPKLFYMQLVTKDWRADLAGCSGNAIGCWIQLCCAMWDDGQCGVATGTVRDLASKCGLQMDEFSEGLLELQQKKIGDITPDLSMLDSKAPITVVCRRMKRAWDKANRKKTPKNDEEKPDKNHGKTGLTTDENQNKTEDPPDTRARARSNSNSSESGSGSEGSAEGDDRGRQTHARAAQVAALWNAVPGNTVLFHNPTGVIALSEALDGLRATYDNAGKAFPLDQAMLAAVHKIAKKRQADGFADVFKPKTLAGTLALAYQVATGEVDLAARPRAAGTTPIDDRPRAAPLESLNLRPITDAEPPPWWTEEQKAAHRARHKGGAGG